MPKIAVQSGSMSVFDQVTPATEVDEQARESCDWAGFTLCPQRAATKGSVIAKIGSKAVLQIPPPV